MQIENYKDEFNTNLLKNFKRNKSFFYFASTVVLAIFVLLFLSLPLLFPKVSLRVFNGYQDFAIPYKSEIIDGRVMKRVVWIDEVQINELKDGDMVAVVDETGTVWIEEIFAVDITNNQVVSTFDGLTVDRVDFEEVAGKFVRQANIIGIFYYFVSLPLGFILMSLAIGGSILVGFYGFVKNIRFYIKKYKENYANDEEITVEFD